MVEAASQPTRLNTLETVGKNLALGTLYTLFAMAALVTWQQTGQAQMLLLAVQEALIVGLAISRRRSLDASRSWWDALIALAGTATPLLQRAGGLALPALVEVGLALQISGVALSLLATLSLGRSFGIVAANRGVKTGGLYRFMRHPLYGSYFVSYIGFLLGNLSPLNLAALSATFYFQYLRARAEEQILLKDPAYRQYVERVRYRFIPFLI